MGRNSDQKFFIENKGQWPDDVLYLSRIGSIDAWITNNGLSLNFYKNEMNKVVDFIGVNNEKMKVKRHGIIIEWVGEKDMGEGVGMKKKKGYYNYFIGNDPSRWVSQVSLFEGCMG